MTYYHHEALVTPRSVTILVTECTKVGGDVYRTALGNVFEFPPSTVHASREAAEAAGVRDLRRIELKIKEYMRNAPMPK